MNFNPSATHLQICARLQRSSSPESARVWVNTPKGGAAVTQGLNKPWHDDTIFIMCPHKYLQQVAEKAIWEGSRRMMIVPRHKNKEWFWGLGEVTVDWWDFPHDALCLLDEGGTPRSPGKLNAQVIISDALGGDQAGLRQTDFRKSHVDPPPQDHQNRPGRRSTAWSENLWEASTKTKSHATPVCHPPSQTRRDESKSVEAAACFSCG